MRIIAAAVCLAVAGCGGDDTATGPAAATTATPAATPAAGLTRADVAARCKSYVPAGAVGAPAALLNPPARVALEPAPKAGGAITRLSGYVGMEPGAFLRAWRARPDVTVDGENEGFEAEVNVQAAGAQVFWKLKKVCESGSTFTAIVTTS